MRKHRCSGRHAALGVRLCRLIITGFAVVVVARGKLF